MSTKKRNERIIKGLQSGRTFRDVAASVGVHHRTAQRVAAREGYYSVRSSAAIPSDFNSKGQRTFFKLHPNY
jgi:hypothetical protein